MAAGLQSGAGGTLDAKSAIWACADTFEPAPVQAPRGTHALSRLFGQGDFVFSVGCRRHVSDYIGRVWENGGFRLDARMKEIPVIQYLASVVYTPSLRGCFAPVMRATASDMPTLEGSITHKRLPSR